MTEQVLEIGYANSGFCLFVFLIELENHYIVD